MPLKDKLAPILRSQRAKKAWATRRKNAAEGKSVTLKDLKRQALKQPRIAKKLRKRFKVAAEEGKASAVAYALIHVMGDDRTLVLASVRNQKETVERLASAYGIHPNGRYQIGKVTVTEL